MTALLYAAIAAWLAEAALATIAVWHYWRGVRGSVPPGFAAPTVVIVPVRGDQGLSRLLPALHAQRFRDWRLIFSLETDSDPAYPLLARFAAETAERPETELVVAGVATASGQKIHNQLAALARLRPRDEVVVFADADIVPRPDWLARLVDPLGRDDVQIVSGWRWLVPDDDRLATAFVAAAHASMSLAPRTRRWALAWGGSTALRRRYLEEIDLPARWRGAVSDDLRLTQVAWAHGGTVLGPSALLLRSPIGYGWRDGAAFIRRQYLFIRIHAPRYWALAAVAVTIPLLGWAAAIATILGGQRWLLLAFALAISLHRFRAEIRGRVARLLWDEPNRRRQRWLDRWAVPAWLLFHAALLWSTAFGRTIRWAGRRYRLDADGNLKSPPESAP
jgi:cellulose synthase/poly-beta-1,6-N-acetylglucosamine synthase-like glycosyltransferase